jgi:MFS family permease
MDTSSFTGVLLARGFGQKHTITVSCLSIAAGPSSSRAESSRASPGGLGFYGLGVYLHALSRLHGWSAGLISVAVTVYYALSAGCLVVVGGLIDRHGPRGVLAYGVVTMTAAVALLGLITAPWQLFAVYVVMATSWSCLSSTGLSSTLLPWFGRRQGLAMTLALTGASVGGMVLVPILVALVQRHGFRFATAAVSLALLAIGLPLVWLVIGGRPTPAQVVIGLGRDGAATEAGEDARQSKVWTRQEVLRAPALDADGALCAGPGRPGRLPRPPDQRARALPGREPGRADRECHHGGRAALASSPRSISAPRARRWR